jgi:pimeloyl-ACP methyl ester carboxylesterase
MRRTLFLALLCLVANTASAFDLTRLDLFDAARQRAIPVLVFTPAPEVCASSCPVVIFGAGYKAAPIEYSFLLEGLANAGFVSVGIQHDIESDVPMPNTGNILQDRGAHWRRGVETTEYVIRDLASRLPRHDWSSLVLAGHSQGGDIAALFAAQTARSIRSLVTLDNRRVALPDTSAFPVLTLRSSDQPADPGVLPDAGWQNTASICVIRLPDTIHDDMNNRASAHSRQTMLQAALSFLLRHGCA